MPYGVSFSWRRAIGASAAKARISRQLGVPLTRSGQERKLGRLVGRGAGLAIVGLILFVLSRL